MTFVSRRMRKDPISPKRTVLLATTILVQASSVTSHENELPHIRGPIPGEKFPTAANAQNLPTISPIEIELMLARSASTHDERIVLLDLLAQSLRWPSQLRNVLGTLVCPPIEVISYVAAPPTAEALVLAAESLSATIGEFPPDEVGVAGDGGVGISWPGEAWSVEVEIDNYGTMYIFHRQRGNPNEMVIAEDHVSDLLEILNEYQTREA